MFFEKFFGWGSSSEQHQQKPLSEKEPFSDTSLQQPNHQTPLSISVTAPDFGYQILGVANGSPAAQAGLIPYFDYIVAIEKQPVNEESSNLLVERAKASLNQPLPLTIYNSRLEQVRAIPIIPSNTWGGTGILGCSFRVSCPLVASTLVWHVVAVHQNSPAQQAGLIADEDWILGSPDVVLKSEDDFYNLMVQNQRRERPVRLIIFNWPKGECRLAGIVPDFNWGGEGCLGCELATGAAHLVPSREYHQLDMTKKEAIEKTNLPPPVSTQILLSTVNEPSTSSLNGSLPSSISPEAPSDNVQGPDNSLNATTFATTVEAAINNASLSNEERVQTPQALVYNPNLAQSLSSNLTESNALGSFGSSFPPPPPPSASATPQSIFSYSASSHVASTTSVPLPAMNNGPFSLTTIKNNVNAQSASSDAMIHCDSEQDQIRSSQSTNTSSPSYPSNSNSQPPSYSSYKPLN